MNRRWIALQAPSWTTAVAVLAIALMAGIALINTSRVHTPVPPGVYLPRSAGTPVSSPQGDPAGPGPTSGNPSGGTAPTGSPAVLGTPASRGTGTAAGPQAPPVKTSDTSRSSGGDTQVSAVAPNYPVDVSSEDQAPSDSSSSGVQTGSTTTSSGDR